MLGCRTSLSMPSIGCEQCTTAQCVVNVLCSGFGIWSVIKVYLNTNTQFDLLLLLK